MTRRGLALLAVAPVIALVLGACGSDDDGPAGMMSGRDMPMTTTTAEADDQAHNAADVRFAQEMIPHHEQALMMTRMVELRSERADVVDLARRIEAAQRPEIATMRAWLESWDEDVPDRGMHAGHGAGGMAGMMSDADIAELRGGSGSTFDTMFLTMMIEHHEGAITMAETELDDGANPDVKALASSIIASQTAEIAEMRAMLG